MLEAYPKSPSSASGRFTAPPSRRPLPDGYATCTSPLNVVLIELRCDPVPSSGQAWTIMPQFLYMSLVAGVIGVLSWNMGNKIITPVNGMLFMNVVPAAAFAGAGAAITVAALVMNNLYQRQKVQRESVNVAGHQNIVLRS